MKAGKNLDEQVKESIVSISGTLPSGEYKMWEKCKMLLPHLKEVTSHTTEDRKGTISPIWSEGEQNNRMPPSPYKEAT